MEIENKRIAGLTSLSGNSPVLAINFKYKTEYRTIYAKADVCRPELLVEIEGIAFSTKTDTVT